MRLYVVTACAASIPTSPSATGPVTSAKVAKTDAVFAHHEAQFVRGFKDEAPSLRDELHLNPGDLIASYLPQS